MSQARAGLLRGLGFALLAGALQQSCTLSPLSDPGAAPGSVLLVVPQSGDPLDERMASQLGAYLSEIVGVEAVVSRPPRGEATEEILEAAATNRSGLVLVIGADELTPSWLTPTEHAPPRANGFRLAAREEGDWANGLSDGRGATFLLTAGPTKLAKQFASYEALRRLGVRFYHPEQEYVPALPPRQIRERARTATVLARPDAGDRYEPDFGHSSFSFHGSHPLEHLESFSDGDFSISEAERVNEWIIKNFGTRFRGPGRGVATPEAAQRRAAELEELRSVLGMERTAGISLHNQQQGANADIDPSSPVPVQQQIEELVEARLADAPDAVHFGIHFGPTEFTTTPDEQTVEWLNWAGQKVQELRPDLPVLINNHITGSQPNDHFGDLGCPPGTNSEGMSDYYDLAFHTAPGLGVSVHTVMFHPLEGPAHVYKQETFSHKLCLMQRASEEGRPLQWFPEGSWWLSYDNSIPVYLPLYIKTRGRDFELVRPLLARGGGSLDDFRMFNSGHEWGYWQQDYAVGLWSFNVDIPLEAVIGEIVDPFCDPRVWPESCSARDEARAVLLDLMEHQERYFLELPDWSGRPGGLYNYFAGEDPADEIAAIAGFEFRPVRPSFEVVLAWTDSQVTSFQFGDLTRLGDAEAEYRGFRERLEAVRDEVPAAGLPWFDEILDGVEINELRARQIIRLYQAVIAHRSGQDASAALDEAAAAVAGAEAVIARREAQYRYPPEQVYGGGLTPETAVENGTTYPFRVHTKTHLLTYWRNRQERAEGVIAGGVQVAAGLVLEPVFAPPGAALDILWPRAETLDGSLDLGDGGVIGPEVTSHDYGSEPGAYAIGGTLSIDGVTIPLLGGVARSDSLYRTEQGALMLVEPSSDLAGTVVADLAPAFRWAWVDASGGRMLAFGPESGDGALSFSSIRLATATLDGGGVVATEPVDFQIPVQGGGAAGGLSLRVEDAVMHGTLFGTELQSPLTVEGELVVGDLVDALIVLAGFDEVGAHQTLGEVLGFDPTAPPQSVPFVAELPIAPSE